jgi:hypothetical protein
MQQFSTFDLGELKLVYRTLHAHLMEHIELMETDFLTLLQSWLQYRAGQEGVDVADHAQWDAWLGGVHVSCEERMKGRRAIKLVEPE